VILVATHADKILDSTLFERGMLLSKQINALNYIQIQSHLVDPDHIFPILISSVTPNMTRTDFYDSTSSCDSVQFKQRQPVTKPVVEVHESDEDTRIEDEPVPDFEELVVPPPVPKDVLNYNDQKRKKKGFKLFKKRKDTDCNIM
jgi:hypothetical protein